MSRAPHWLALLPEEPDGDVAAAAAVRERHGAPAGWLVSWAAERRPHPTACRVDPAAVDPDGPVAAVSLVLPAPDRRPLFDDPAVVRAVRAVAGVPGLTAASTLTADPVRFAGSLLATGQAVVEGWPGWWELDPFARLGPRRRLLVDAGMLSDRCPALGPGTQRRAGAPWPAGW